MNPPWDHISHPFITGGDDERSGGCCWEAEKPLFWNNRSSFWVVRATTPVLIRRSTKCLTTRGWASMSASATIPSISYQLTKPASILLNIISGFLFPKDKPHHKSARERQAELVHLPKIYPVDYKPQPRCLRNNTRQNMTFAVKVRRPLVGIAAARKISPKSISQVDVQNGWPWACETRDEVFGPPEIRYAWTPEVATRTYCGLAKVKTSAVWRILIQYQRKAYEHLKYQQGSGHR